MATIFDASLNPTLPEVAINIGGAERPLSFSYAAITTLEARYETSVADLMSRMDQISIAANLLHAALVGGDPSLTIEQVIPWVNYFSLKPIQQALLAAWFGSFPEDDGAGEAVPQAARKSAKKHSARSGRRRGTI